MSPLPLNIDAYNRTPYGAKPIKAVYQIGPTPKAETLSDHYGTDKQYNLYGPQRRGATDTFGVQGKTWFGAVDDKGNSPFALMGNW